MHPYFSHSQKTSGRLMFGLSFSLLASSSSVFLPHWELGSHLSHPTLGYSYVFSLAGHTNAGRKRAALALKVHLLSWCSETAAMTSQCSLSVLLSSEISSYGMASFLMKNRRSYFGWPPKSPHPVIHHLLNAPLRMREWAHKNGIGAHPSSSLLRTYICI